MFASKLEEASSRARVCAGLSTNRVCSSKVFFLHAACLGLLILPVPELITSLKSQQLAEEQVVKRLFIANLQVLTSPQLAVKYISVEILAL